MQVLREVQMLNEYLLVDGPPADSLPGVADLSLLLHRDSDVLIGLDSFRVWPAGLGFTLLVRVSPRVAEGEDVFGWLQPEPAERGQPSTALELGIRVGDVGAVWCAPHLPSVETDSVVVQYSGGSAGVSGGDYAWWLSPLPKVGVAFSCRWTGRGIRAEWVTVEPELWLPALGRVQPADW